jgi:hypothetical protein
MANDVVTPSNPPIVLVKEEEFEEAPLDMNVSQWSCDKDSFQRMVHIQINHLAWDRRSFPNPHALTIYFEFVPTCGTIAKRFEKCQCEDDDVRLHYQT